MPLYEISHSFPLTRKLKDQLAKQITELHATTFTTPSLFVNVHFKDIDATAENYYIAGSTRVGGINRITGMVRTAESRTKKDFDSLSEKIEGIWNSVVRGLGDEAEDKDGNKKKVDETDKEKEAKRLHAVFLYQMVAARESGITIPTVSETVLFDASEDL